MIVETDRLLLREFVEDDVQAYYTLGSYLAVARYTGMGHLTNLEHALEVLRANPLADYQKHGFGRWACVLKSNSEVIGFAGLKRLVDLNEVDVAFWLLPTYWGQGLATEAGRAALDFGLGTLQLKRIIGLVDPANLASARVLEKLGMIREGLTDYQGEETIRHVVSAVES